MRAARVLFVVSLLVVGLAVSATAQITCPMDRVTSGTFDAKVAIVPAALPGGAGSLPPELQNIGPDLYTGQVEISQAPSGFSVVFRGERADGARLVANADFAPGWTGLLFGNLVVGSSLESCVIVSIDAAHMLRAQINGVGTVSGVNQRVIVRLGAGAMVTSVKILKAPGPLR